MLFIIKEKCNRDELNCDAQKLEVFMNSNPHILVVDVDVDFCSFLKEKLTAMNYLVSVASTGNEALEHLKSGHYKLVICDLKLPDISYKEIFQEAKKSSFVPEFIAITQFGSIENAVEAMRLGVFDYITRGIERNPEYIEFIEEVIRNAVKHQKLKAKY